MVATESLTKRVYSSTFKNLNNWYWRIAWRDWVETNIRMVELENVYSTKLSLKFDSSR